MVLPSPKNSGKAFSWGWGYGGQCFVGGTPCSEQYALADRFLVSMCLGLGVKTTLTYDCYSNKVLVADTSNLYHIFFCNGGKNVIFKTSSGIKKFKGTGFLSEGQGIVW